MLISPLDLLMVVALAASASPTAARSPCPAILNHEFTNLRDEPVSLCGFSGKVLLIVNTASECGYTPQYEGLEKLYRRYRELWSELETMRRHALADPLARNWIDRAPAAHAVHADPFQRFAAYPTAPIAIELEGKTAPKKK